VANELVFNHQSVSTICGVQLEKKTAVYRGGYRVETETLSANNDNFDTFHRFVISTCECAISFDQDIVSITEVHTEGYKFSTRIITVKMG
jgi:hypothetical protein